MIFRCIFGFLTLTAASVTAETVVVTAARLNVRARAGTQYEVVCQITQGQELEVVERRGEWVGVRPPASTHAWVEGKNLDGGRMMADESPAYAGAATVFSVLGTYKKDEQLTVHRTRQDGWAEVSPPADAVVWVHTNYLRPPGEVPPTPVVPPTADPVVAEQPVPPVSGEIGATVVAPAQPAIETPPPISGARERWEPEPGTFHIHRITPNPPAGPAQYLGDAVPFAETGIVVPLNDPSTPWPFVLAVRVNDTYYPLAYLATGKADLAGWQWREVTVTGSRRWVKGWPRPLAEIESLRGE